MKVWLWRRVRSSGYRARGVVCCVDASMICQSGGASASKLNLRLEDDDEDESDGGDGDGVAMSMKS